MLKSLTRVQSKISQKSRQISQKARRLSQKKLNLSIKRRKRPQQDYYQPEDKHEIMVFDVGYPTNHANYSTESFNPVQEYDQYPRVHHPADNWKLNNRYYEAAVDPNMLDFGRLNINDPREQYNQQFVPAPTINRRRKCRGCALPFNYDPPLTISSPDETNPTHCIGCERLFGSMSSFQVHQRLHHSTNMTINNPVFETHFLNDTSMHPHHNCIPPYDNEYTLFHLPCSPNYYRRFVNKYGDPKYVLNDVQPVIKKRVQHFYECKGCRQFTEHERSPIYYNSHRILGEYEIATHKQMLTFLSHNMTCMETGLQGCWSPTGKEFFSLQLELRKPVMFGGRGFVDNFKVSLVGIDSLLALFDRQDVRRWLEAVKEYQGYYPPN